jgi:hypothetical protein
MAQAIQCHMIAMIRDKVAEGVAECPGGSLKRSRRIAEVAVSGEEVIGEGPGIDTVPI